MSQPSQLLDAGQIIAIPSKEGSNHYEVLCTFIDETTDDTYALLAPLTDGQPTDGEVEITAIRYEEKDGKLHTYTLTTEEEWDMAEDVLNQYLQELKSE